MSTHSSFALVSDLHLNAPVDWRTLVNVDAEYLIIDGDTYPIIEIDVLVLFCATISKESKYKKIVYVCGNHEFYNTVGATFPQLLALFRERTAHLANFVILYNETIDLDNIRVFGTTLWSKIPDEQLVSLPLYDEFGGIMSTARFNEEHYRAIAALERAILGAKIDRKRLLVVSHYAPTFQGTLSPKHFEPSVKDHNVFYCSALERFLNKDQVYCWVYAHTHVNADLRTKGDTRLVSNQYRGEGFDPRKVLFIRNEKLKSLAHSRHFST